MRTLLPYLSSLLLLAPLTAGAERRAPTKEPRGDKGATPAARGAPEKEAPRPPAERGTNDEPDPAQRQRFEQRRADAVETRQMGRAIAQIGRQTKSPLALLAAVQLLQRVAPARPLQGGPGGPQDEGWVPSRSCAPAAQPAILQAADLLTEARALATARGGTLQREQLAMIDQLAASEVTTRGAALGPQSTCETTFPGTKLTYNVAYDGGERAAVAISGAAVGDLVISVTDEEGHLLTRTWDRPLISWYPRWRGVFRIDIENRAPQRVEFCIETN